MQKRSQSFWFPGIRIILKPGFTIKNPRVPGKHPFFYSFERVVCTNGMVETEKGFNQSFSIFKNTDEIIDEYGKMLYRKRDYAYEIQPFRNMIKTGIDKEMIQGIKKVYGLYFVAAKKFEGKNFWDLYNSFTSEAMLHQDWSRVSLVEKAAELIHIFREEDEALRIEAVWKHLKLI